MVKKLRAMTKSRASNTQLAEAIRNSAQEIWLAGLGAFAKAQEEGNKVYAALVKEGNAIQKRTMRVTEDKVNEVTGAVTKITGSLQKQAGDTWDKLETVFEQRVERALKRLGMPSSREIAELNERIEALTETVQKLSGGRSGGKAPARKVAARKPAARKAAPRRKVTAANGAEHPAAPAA